MSGYLLLEVFLRWGDGEAEDLERKEEDRELSDSDVSEMGNERFVSTNKGTEGGRGRGAFECFYYSRDYF